LGTTLVPVDSSAKWSYHRTTVPLHQLLPRPTAVDAAAFAVKRAIFNGEIAVGERLPPERELAAAMGLNRVTLRAALGRLAQEGLVQVRHGSGSVVLDWTTEGGPALLPELAEWSHEHDLPTVSADLLLVRRSLARAVLERLAQSRASLDPVREAIARFRAAVADGDAGDAIAEADVAVVAALVTATGSAALRLCLNPILGVLRALPALRDAMYADPLDNVRAFETFVEAWEQARTGRDARAALATLSEALVAELERRDEATLRRLKKHLADRPSPAPRKPR